MQDDIGVHDRLVQQAREDIMKELVMGQIVDVFTSSNPDMVKMRF